jgi:hypothetical protein
MFRAQDSCGNENLLLIDDRKGELIAQHVLEPGEELEEVVSVTPSEITVIVNNDNTDALLAEYNSFLSQNPTWGQLGEGVMEAQVVTASSHFADLLFGTPSRAAAFDKWYDEVYQGLPSERALRTYRIVKAEKRLAMTQERVFKESVAEQLVDDGIEGPSERRTARAYITGEVSNDGRTLKLRSYAYKTAVRVPPR